MLDETIEFLHEEGVFSLQAPDFEQPLEGAGWRLAKSLVVLREEANKKAPNRNKGYDGTIGDTSHASRASRHNPNNSGVVCALDITHDPSNGMDTYALFDFFITHPHPDLEYVISNKRVATRTNGWKVRKYTGSNSHSNHIHVAVGRGPDREPYRPYDDTTPWGIGIVTPEFPYGKRVLKIAKPFMSGNDVLWCQQQINKLKTYPQNVTQHLNEDGIYGKETANCIKVFQYRIMKDQDPDGIVGQLTWKALRLATNN